MVMKLTLEHPVTLVFQILDNPRSLYYYEGKGWDEEALKKAIMDVAGAWPTYGYRWVTAPLRRDDWQVNAKRVRRVMAEIGLEGKAYRCRRRTMNSDHPFPRFPNVVSEFEVPSSDYVWVSDIPYIRRMSEFVYLTVIMNVFTRSIRGWHLGRGLDQELTLVGLRKALERGSPRIHHSDQGVQCALHSLCAGPGRC